MTARYAAVPLSSPLESSDAVGYGDANLPDKIQIVDDVHGDLYPDGGDDAASADDPAIGPPSRAALLQHRVKEAMRHFQAEGLGAPEIRAMTWPLVVEAKAPGAPKARAETGPVALAEARLGERDARGEANKHALDRPEGSEGAAFSRPAVGVWGEEEPHRKTKRAPLPSWASLAIDPVDPACVCKCRGRWAKSGKEQLIHAVLRERASGIPERLLRENYTKLGLRALLCGALCGRGDELLQLEAAGKLPPARGARAPQMHRP